MKQSRALITVLLFWLAVLAGFTAYNEIIIRRGHTVYLKTQPVDPRDLFRGDYVVLTYDISRIPLDRFRREPETGDDVYVVLKKQPGQTAEMEYVASYKPERGLFLKGNITDISSNRARVTYGIESYFVPEGEGRAIEREMGNIRAEIKIGRGGQGILKSLILP